MLPDTWVSASNSVNGNIKTMKNALGVRIPKTIIMSCIAQVHLPTTHGRNPSQGLNYGWKKHQTKHQVIQAIIDGLQAWREMKPPPSSPKVQAAIDAQSAIGWFPFMMGQTTQEWEFIQEEHLQKIGSKRHAKTWTTQVLKQLMMVAWDMWADRNNIKHHTITHAKQREIDKLDELINHEFQLGTKNLRSFGKTHLHKGLSHVLRYDIITKRQWLESMRVARKKEQPSEPTSEEMRQRAFMYDWLLGDLDINDWLM